MRRASVIIPAFNAAETIGQTVTSALRQAGVDLEILVVNDSSTDSTEAVVHALARQDSRVRLLQNAGPRGPSAARNTAIRASVGDWLVLLDADDTLLEDRIPKLIAEAETRELDALADNLFLIDDETGRVLGTAFPDWMMGRAAPIDLKWLLLHDMPGGESRTVGCCKPVLRARALKETGLFYDEDVRISEDYLLYGTMILAGLRFGVTPAPGYRYHLRTASLVHSAGNSDGHVAVNRRLWQAWRGSKSAASEDLGTIFTKREAAFRYADFVYAARSRRGLALVRAVGKLRLAFALRKLTNAAVKRFSRALSPAGLARR